MQSETPERNATQGREIAVFRIVAGAWLLMALTFGLLNLSGLIHVV